MVCTGCGTVFDGLNCPACGSDAPAEKSHNAGVELRAGAYLIDLVPAMMLSFCMSWFEDGGTKVAGAVLLAWWLLRDLSGASLGKRMLKLRVIRQDGGESGPRERILRNVTLIGGPVAMLVPVSVSGTFAGSFVGLIVTIIEIATLVLLKQRLGDMLAGSAVAVRK